ncbi:MAG TPA: TonB-dependent receptor [Ignavibacteria bacterium]|nr:TonB-dependent receptor [Ignavibacteria bacterium]HMR40359.1 TonB-dependent receptor [Ignavibacteria bacterium]
MSLLFIFQISALETYGQGSLEGKIIDEETSSVVSLANIKIFKDGSDDFVNTQSDVSGKFSFIDLDSGVYMIEVTSIGYEEYTNQVMIEDLKVKILNVFLKPAGIEIEKINVTSTKTEVTLQQTPSSISIVTAEDISKKNILTFDNVLEQVQGVTLNRSSGINVNSMSIRGSSDVAGGGIGNRVLLLLDGRPSLTGDSKGALWSLIPVSIIDRTEVVKGAFSSLYGSSAIGGVVNVITKKPTYNSSTSMNFSYGFYEKLNDSLRYTNDLLTFTTADIIHSNTINKFSYLLNLNYNNNDGHSQQSNYDFYSGVGKFTYDLFGNRDLEATLQYTKSNSGFPHYWRKDAGSVADPYKIAEYYLGDKIQKETQSYDLFYRAVPNSISKYTTRFYYYYLYSNSYYNPNNPVSIEFADTGKGLNTYIDSYNIGNITQVDFQFGKYNYFVSGIDFQMNIVKSDPQEILYGDQQMNNFGIFAQDQYKIITDKLGNSILETTLGARLDFNKVVSGIESSEISPKVSFVYTPDTENKVFKNTAYRFLVGRAFRAPSIAEIYFKKELFGGFDFLYNPDLQPEYMISAEIGLRKQFTTRFTFDMAFFFNEYENLIQYVNTSTSIYGPFQVQNIAKSQISGFEFSLDYNSSVKLFKNPLDYFFNISYTYLNAKDLSENRKDDFLPYKPVNNFLFTTNFGYYGFNLDIYGKYLSAIDEVLFYNFEEPESYFLLNLKISKEITNKISFFLAVNNLFDESYQELERIQAPNRNFNSGFSLQF